MSPGLLTTPTANTGSVRCVAFPPRPAAAESRPSERSDGHPASRATGGEADLLFSLVLLQCGFGVLASLSMMVLMGNAVFLVLPLLKLVALLFIAGRAAAQRRWAMITMIAIQAVALAGYLLGAVLGLLPALTFTFNLVGLITGVSLPAAVIWLCARLLRARTGAHYPAQDPVNEENQWLASAVAQTSPGARPR